MPDRPPFDTAALHALVPLAATLGLRVAEAAPERVRLELDHRPELCTAGGVLHGGAIMALADTAGALCAYLNLPEGATGTTTVESKTNLLAAVRVRPGLLRHDPDGLSPQDLLLQGRHRSPPPRCYSMSRASRSAHVSRRTTSRADPSAAKTTGIRRVPL